MWNQRSWSSIARGMWDGLVLVFGQRLMNHVYEESSYITGSYCG